MFLNKPSIPRRSSAQKISSAWEARNGHEDLCENRKESKIHRYALCPTKQLCTKGTASAVP